MQQTILNLLTAGMADLKATTAERGSTGALTGDSSFGALLSQAMDAGAQQGAARGVGTVVPSASLLDLPGLLSVLLGENAQGSPQAPQAAADPATQQTKGTTPAGAVTNAGSVGQAVPSASPLDLPGLLSVLLGENAQASPQTVQAAADPAHQVPGDESKIESGTWKVTSAGVESAKTSDADANSKPEQQLQDLVMGLLALVLTKDAGTGGQTAVATGSDPGEEQAAAVAGSGLVNAVKGREETGLSQRSKTASNGSASNSAPETDNRRLLDTLALLLFTGLEAMRQEPGKASDASRMTQSTPAEDGRTGAEIAAALQRTSAAESGGTKAQGRVTLQARDEINGFAARLVATGTDAAASPSGGTKAYRAEFALSPAGDASADGNNLSLRISSYWAPASGYPAPAPADGASPS